MSDFGSSSAAPPRLTIPRATGSARINVGPFERIASAVAGSLLIGAGMRRGSLIGLAAAGVGASLAYRGASGHCPTLAALGIDHSGRTGSGPLEIVQSQTVNRPRDEVYAFWRNLENLPRFMTHLERVEELDERRSRWKAALAGPTPAIEWTAEIVDDQPGSILAWRSEADADIDNSGHVRFADAPRGGTEIHVRIAYRPPAGEIGEQVAKWLDPMLEKLIREDLRRFKHLVEAGEIPTTNGQPSGRG